MRGLLQANRRRVTYLRDLPALVVATYQRDAIRIPHFQSKKQQERFHAVETTIHEISHEQIVRLRTIPSHAEQLGKIVKLETE
jgi:hypothetical protein